MATREAPCEPSIAELESSVFLGQSIITDAQIMRAMEPAQPVQEQRGANYEQVQKAPLPNILDREMDLRHSRRIRRADAAAAAAAVSSQVGQERKMGQGYAKAGRPPHSPMSSSSEYEDGRLGATAVADPVEGTTGTAGVPEPAASLAPKVGRFAAVEAGARGEADDGDMAGSRRWVAHPKSPNPHPNKARGGRFSFVPGDDGLLATNRQADSQSTPRAHRQAYRPRHGEDENATRVARPPSPPATRPLPDDDLTAPGQDPRTAATAAVPSRGAESSGRHGHRRSSGATPGSIVNRPAAKAGHQHELCVGQTEQGTPPHRVQKQSLNNAQIAASKAVSSMRE